MTVKFEAPAGAVLVVDGRTIGTLPCEATAASRTIHAFELRFDAATLERMGATEQELYLLRHFASPKSAGKGADASASAAVSSVQVELEGELIELKLKGGSVAEQFRSFREFATKRLEQAIKEDGIQS
jgi:hypothetical protein